jgi:hypothetical protein
LNNYDCLVQNNRDRCEMVGSHKKNFNHIFNMHVNDCHLENVWKARTSEYKNIFICKILPINETQMGGIPEKRTTI